MNLRKSEPSELDVIYNMGFDVWNGGLSLEEYLTGCRNSDKYRAGTWYVLIENGQIVSSLIVYSGLFGLKEGCYGIGSVATPLSLRGKGYASQLIRLVTAELFARSGIKAVYLHSDIGHEFYRKLGFATIAKTDCMLNSKDTSLLEEPIPEYF
ncbi:GNAT family N-acetyltransferase [Vibrio sp. T187]|uniref:GNAT family N-acetyltransferase n=1 Tax=Vibrio TaxID=662 RepID=UPI0010C9C5D2|nr:MULTISPECIES: GNAT family N-acetyltransferase [Vibrio]MBW3697728.1 GNAT family N-acetyltransferase [Vibrio sp. T187]